MNGTRLMKGMTDQKQTFCGLWPKPARNSLLFKHQRSANEAAETLKIRLTYERPDVYRHCLRVAATSRSIAAAMELTSSEVFRIGQAAEWHDIGKLAIPHNVLYKRGRLTPREYGIVMQHMALGEKLLRNVLPSKSTIMQVVRFHHEHVDGSGTYGLSGSEIPLAARIVSVADAFDAMTYRRIYRKPLSVRSALAELWENSDSQFDAEVVRVFCEVIRTRRYFHPQAVPFIVAGEQRGLAMSA